MAADVEYHVRRYQRLKAKRALFDILNQEVAEFLLPYRSVITRKRPEGAKQTDRLFDATPGHALELLASNIHGSVTNPQARWFTLKMREKQFNDMPNVRLWLDEVEERMYLALQQSNFNPETNEVYLDLGAFGIGCLYIEEKDKVVTEGATSFGGLRFRAFPPGGFAIDEDADGRVDTCYTSHKLTARAVVQRWSNPNDHGKLIADMARDKPEQEYEILHCVGPRTSYDPSKVTAKNKAIYSLWIALPHNKLLGEGGYEEFPYVVPRWSKTSGEMYGRSPAHTALPDVRTLNRCVELTLESAAASVAPPVEVPNDGVIGDLDLRAHGVNTVDDSMSPGKPVIKPIQLGANFDVSQVLSQDLRARIQHIFFYEQLQLPQDQTMTATEVRERTIRILRLLAPWLSRLESEYLNLIINRVFGLMLRANALPPLPDELQGQDMDIEYEGPLAQAQKHQHIEAFQAWLATMLPLIQIKPDILDNLNTDQLGRDLALDLGWSSRWLADPQQRDQMRAQRQQAAQRQADMDKASQVAEMAKNASPALDSLTNMGQAMGSPNGQTRVAA